MGSSGGYRPQQCAPGELRAYVGVGFGWHPAIQATARLLSASPGRGIMRAATRPWRLAVADRLQRQTKPLRRCITGPSGHHNPMEPATGYLYAG